MGKQSEHKAAPLQRINRKKITMVKPVLHVCALLLALLLAGGYAFAQDYDDYDDYDDNDLSTPEQIAQRVDEFSRAMRESAAASDAAGCEPIPEDQWGTISRGPTGYCSYNPEDYPDLWQSIAGEGRSVANDIGQSFGDGAPLLLPNGTAMVCVTTMDYSGNFSDAMQSACWPDESSDESSGAKMVRIVLKLPIMCESLFSYLSGQAKFPLDNPSFPGDPFYQPPTSTVDISAEI